MAREEHDGECDGSEAHGEGGVRDPRERRQGHGPARAVGDRTALEGLEQTDGKANLSEGEVEYSLETEFVDSGVLSFRRRIRYFSDGVMLGSKSFCQEKFNEFRSYFKTKRTRTGKLITRSHLKEKVSAPEGNLLHLHSIRSFMRLNR